MDINKTISNIARKYNHKRYWKMRNLLFERNLPIIKYFILFYLKRTEQNSCSYIGVNLAKENNFLCTPTLPHGLNGIVIAKDAKIGSNVTIHQQVTIGLSMQHAPIIGNDVFIGAGAKIIGKVTVGNHCRIGANCVVFKDIPDNCTVVLDKPRLIIKNKDYVYYTE